MHALILKLISHALNATVTLLSPPQKAPHAGPQSNLITGAVNTSSRRQPTPEPPSTMPPCDWSICVDDPLTGEPRGLIFTSESLSEAQAVEQAQAVLTTFRILGSFIPSDDAKPNSTVGLYFFTYRLNHTQKLAAIWAHSSEDAVITLDNMASCGNLLCYCEPES